MAAARAHFNLTSTSAVSRSWHHSPVPYLFGGLAVMMGMISFALLVLACSYWRLSGYLNSEGGSVSEGSGEPDLEGGEAKQVAEAMENEAVFEDKVLVIMAGEKEPRFLATPVTNNARYHCFGDCSSNSSSFSCVNEKIGGLEMVREDSKEGRIIHPENGETEIPTAEIHPTRRS